MLLKVISIVIFYFFPLLAFSAKLLTLSLDEAILVASRFNPNVQQVQLAHVLQKFNLHVQEWQFDLHYAFQVSTALARPSNPNHPSSYSQNYNIQPGLSYLAPVGTQFNFGMSNIAPSGFTPSLSLQVMQPLMRGFGKAIVESALNNARDSEKISRLTIESTLRATVTAVINAYLDVISAERAIVINQDALKRARQSVDQTKAYIKAGRKAGNELVTVSADVARVETQLENAKNNYLQARYALLMAIGMDPNTEIKFSSINLDSLIKKYFLPPLEKTKQLILENDIQYQIDQIVLHGPTTRSLLVAEDNTRWQLNFATNIATGGIGTNRNTSISNLFNESNLTQGVGLVLQIPIDDQLLKQAVINAKIALKQAEISLLQEKWNKETSAINGWNTVLSAKRALSFAEDAEILQEKTYTISYQKYLHGLIDSLELQAAQLQLIQTQHVLLNARITYLKSLVNLDYLIGHTLNTWNIKVRLA